MDHWEQYEVWKQAGDKWEMLAWFRDFEVASALLHTRSKGVRLVHAVCDPGKPVQRDTIAEIHSGATREHP